MALDTVDLSPHIGTEVVTDRQSLTEPAVAAELRNLLVQRGVLLLREINLSDEEQVALAGLLGRVREEGENGIFKITLDKSLNARADYLKGAFQWHLDGTHDDVPIFASLLSARKLAPSGGDTEFANTYKAYAELPEETRQRIDGLRAVHSVETSMRRGGVEPTEDNLAYWRSLPDKAHSLVWRHDSGRKSLVIGCHAKAIEGMVPAEGDKLLQELLDWTTQPRFVYRHQWRPGDMLIWDNTGVLHRATPYALDSGREMHRTTLLGEEAFS